MIFTTETLLWLGYATYFCAQLAVGAHILFTKHEEPSSALLWLLIITIFPVIGLLMYSMFGINRLRSMGMSVHAFAEELEASKEKYLGKAVVNYLSCLKTFSASLDEHDKTFARTLKN
ncbi:MAG: PLDc N-terminal domain-containing protein, partial [Victivallaceae bacterium]